MNKLELKLNDFASDIMTDVNHQKAAIIEQAQLEIDQEYERKELEYLTKAYNLIQDGLKKIEREKNELVSKKMMENRIKLLNKRSEIIEAAFSAAEKSLVDFCGTPEYEAYLLKMIEDNLKIVGREEAVVYLVYTDAAYKSNVESKFKVKVEFENKAIKMLGGCKVYNPARNIFIDDSFAKRLEIERDQFLEKCNLAIE